MEACPQTLRATTLAQCPSHHEFLACRGDVVSNITDLANCIASLSNAEFKVHVNEEKNDFAAWICHTLQNPFLSRDLDHVSNKESQVKYVQTIRDHISWLENTHQG